MRRIVLVLMTPCLVLSLGCGHLKAKVVTSRDLTKEEVGFYKEHEDGFRLVVLYPITTWGKALVGAGGDEIIMGRMFTALNLPVPIFGFGFSSIQGAMFDDEGQRRGHFGVTGFAPLFTHMGFKIREKDEQWRNVVSYSSFLGIFGYGKCEDKPIIQVLFNFGASSDDIAEAMPDLSFFGE